MMAKRLSYPSLCIIFYINGEFHSPWNHTYFFWLNNHFAHHCSDEKLAFERNNQEIPIGVIESLLVHRYVGRVSINTHSRLECRLSWSRNWDQTFNEIFLLTFLHSGNFLPSVLVRVIFELRFVHVWCHNFIIIGRWTVFTFYDRGSNFVEPGTLIFCSFDYKRGAGELFGIETILDGNGAILI